MTPRSAESKPARKRGKAIFWTAGLLIGLAAAYGLWRWQPWASQPALVEVETLAPAPASRILAVNGRVAALNSIEIRPAVSGQITSVAVVENDVVESGAVLARIVDDLARSDLDQAQAARGAGAVRLTQAQSALDRATALAGNVARSTREDAELAVQIAQGELDRLSGIVAQAESRLANYTLTAPFAGTIITRAVEPGAMVDMSTTLFTLADLTDLVVEADIDEIYAAQITEGLAAVLQPAGMSGHLAGRVSFAAPRIDPATGGRLVRLTFDEVQDLPVGLTVAINIVVDQQEAALTLPRAALTISDGRASAMVLRDGIATEVDVDIIDWPADRLIVTEGLQAGDAVILTPVAAGDAVRVAP